MFLYFYYISSHVIAMYNKLWLRKKIKFDMIIVEHFKAIFSLKCYSSLSRVVATNHCGY